MSFRSRITAVILVLLMLIFAYYQGAVHMDNVPQGEQRSLADTTEEKNTIHVWYTDEALTDYMNSCALSFSEENKNIRVVPALVSAVEYLENINDATMKEDVYPDVYLTTNDCLEKAYMAGLATEITDPDSMVNKECYPETALQSVTCDGKQVAYPFYYETTLFLYNQTYLESMAQTKIEALAAQAEADALEGEAFAGDAEGEEKKSVTGADDLIPTTMDDILTLADEYDAPEGVEAILKWDVSDIFYNYFFAGNYMNIGGSSGDDASVVDIYNEQSVSCMKLYQSLNQFFSIEASETDYASVLQEFIEGKTIFTVATTDAIAKIEQAKADGRFTWGYSIATLPNISEELQSRGLSVTNVAVVNGYSRNKESANAFASYLACRTDASLYERTGKLAANQKCTYENPRIDLAMDAYKKSASLPKIMELSNFWVQLEVAYTDIWQGEDADRVMMALEDRMRGQVK